MTAHVATSGADIVRNLLGSISEQAEHLDDISDPAAFDVLADRARDLLEAFFDYPPDHDDEDDEDDDDDEA